MPDTEENKDAPAQENNESSGKAEKKVGKIKPGDYTVHLLLQKGKEFAIEESDTKDIFVQVEISKLKETSPVQNEVSNLTVVNFNAHIFIELKKMSIQQLEQSRITIKVLEKAYFKVAMIGMFEFDFNHVYFMDGHKWEHVWVALTNPESEDYSEINGYLKVSTSIYGADDDPHELIEDPNNDDDNVQIPASVKPNFKQIKLHIHKGEHLPKLDTALIGQGKMDAFVDTKINGKRIKTKIIETKNDEATWNETFFIPVRVPVMSGKLVLGVWDYDTVNDEQAGSLIFDFKQLLEMP